MEIICYFCMFILNGYIWINIAGIYSLQIYQAKCVKLVMYSTVMCSTWLHCTVLTVLYCLLCLTPGRSPPCSIKFCYLSVQTGKMFLPGHVDTAVHSLRSDSDHHLSLHSVHFIDCDGPLSPASGYWVVSSWHPWSFLFMMDHRHMRWWIVRSGMLPGSAMLNIRLFGLFGLFVPRSPLLAVLPFKPWVW